jgi:hypothetical protein
MKAPTNTILALAITALLLGGVVMVFVAKSAQAKPEFAAQTSKPCTACHTNPAGSGPLTPAGEDFKKQLPK